MAVKPSRLTEFEYGLVSLGITAATAFSLPKSVGAMFGLSLGSVHPLALDDFVERLGISKGSASNGLKFLQRIGAVKAVGLADGRRSHYEPETSLRRLLIGILNENVVPHLQQGGDKLESLRDALAGYEKAEQQVLGKRLEAIEAWNRKGRRVLPLLEKVLARPLG